jgi:alkyl sulfatase BDS1-like metallo-beta-lactamase superfamily hydrolase
MRPELVVPAHGLPIEGTARIVGVLETIASTLETLVDQVIEMMNGGAKLDEIVHTVTVPDEILEKPYLRPLYDEPEFVVRGVWRQFGGWWDGAASRGRRPAGGRDCGARRASSGRGRCGQPPARLPPRRLRRMGCS